MPAQADCVVVRCMDPRLNEPVRVLAWHLKIPPAHGLISVPGGPQGINDPTRGIFLAAVGGISLPLHGAKRALLIQHTDCDAYGGREACGRTPEADLAFHQDELRKAMGRLREDYPSLEVIGYVAHLLAPGTVDFVEPEGRTIFDYRS